ncbi:MAG: homoserine O-succinyltransferase [Enterococcus sp.]
MPIRLDEDFPAKAILEQEDIFAIDNKRAIHQDIRPLKLVIVNLMPKKIETEIQLLRLLSQTPLQLEIDFVQMASHESKNVSASHLNRFYKTFAEIKEQFYDGLIITGAPVEQLKFEEVDYWQELTQVLDWSRTHVASTLHICWGAQAGLYYHYGVDKVSYQEKLFGIYTNKLNGHHTLTRGFDDQFFTPQSRYTGIDETQLAASKLAVVARNPEIGSTIIISEDRRDVFILGHFEYDTPTLKDEYYRDLEKGLGTEIPENYFRYNHVDDEIINCWRGHACLFYRNWINDVYQDTEYHLPDLLKRNRKLNELRD